MIMAAPAKSKGPAPKSKKPGKSLGSLYLMSGEKIQRKNKFCPKCGPGSFMALHKDRTVCGKCHYTEFSRRG